MKRFLWLLPALAHILFGAHLLHLGFSIVVALIPVAFFLLMAVRRRFVRWFEEALLFLYAIEWARAGWDVVSMRAAYGLTYHPALEIMAGVTVFTIIAALVFELPSIRAYYGAESAARP